MVEELRNRGEGPEDNRNTETMFPDGGNKVELLKRIKSDGKGRLELGRKK